MQVQSPVACPRPSVPGPRPPTAPRPVFRSVLSPPAAAAPANNGQGSPPSRDRDQGREAEVRAGANSSPGEEFLRQKRTRPEFMRWTQTQAAAASAATDAQIASTAYSPARQAAGPVRLIASSQNPPAALEDPGQAASRPRCGGRQGAGRPVAGGRGRVRSRLRLRRRRGPGSASRCGGLAVRARGALHPRGDGADPR